MACTVAQPTGLPIFKSAEDIELPNKLNILEWYVELGTPKRIAQHCQAAGQLAEFLAEKIDAHIEPYVNPALAKVLNEVHDMAKAVTLDTKGFLYDPTTDTWNWPSWNEFKGRHYLRKNFKGMHETQVATYIIEPEFPEFAQIVRQLGSTANPIYLNSPFREVLIAHYTDWRTSGVKLVPLNQRFSYLRKYFKGDSAAWAERGAKEVEIEATLFQNLTFGPEKLGFALLQKIEEKRSMGSIHYH
jgi:hypothetical protein